MFSHPRRWHRAITIAAFALCAGDGDPGADADRGVGTPPALCPTEDAWLAKRTRRGAAVRDDGCTHGPCDEPSVRNEAPAGPIVVRLAFHVMADEKGTGANGIDADAVAAQVEQLNLDFAGTGFSFRHVARFHVDPRNYCIPAWSPSDPAWFAAIETIKSTYAEEPARRVNVFVSCQASSPLGTVKGIATFPWDPDALSPMGGAWVNSAHFGANNHTLTHEIGHALGLLHTHHANAGEGCGNECYERVHVEGDAAADLLGDLCGDTPATPANYECGDPPGRDCDGTPWTEFGRTDFANFMGYAPDWCASNFTPQQRARMHCWSRGALAGVVEEASPRSPAATLALENRPNPANPSTTFRCSVPQPSRVTLRVYDIHGRLVVTLLDAQRDAGVFELPWDGRNRDGAVAPSGVYYAHLEGANAARTARVVLLK